MKAWFALSTILIANELVAGQTSNQPTPALASAASKGSHPQMQRVMEALVGTWSISEITIPSPGAPARSTHSGTEVWQTATGGMTLIEENETRLPGGDAHDTAVLWWDGKAQRIRGIWCADINSEGCSSFTVSWESPNLIMMGEWEDEGGRHAWKEEFAFAGPDSFTQTLLVGPPGGDLKRVSVIHAKRSISGKKGLTGWRHSAPGRERAVA